MDIDEIEILWGKAIKELLGSKLDGNTLSILAKQTYDSIRRIEIYKSYKLRAANAVKENKDFIHTSNPFVLAQRLDLNLHNRLWVLYLATYFGKSNRSKWTLFNRATFDHKNSIILFDEIKLDINKYFKYLSDFDFFEGSAYSNHRKYTAKNLNGDKGVFKSMEYFANNIEQYHSNKQMKFHELYLLSQKIPNFGRLASFDFSSSLVKCGFNVKEPESMYADHSTGPLQAIGLILRLTNNDTSANSKKKLSSDLVKWFSKSSDIFMIGQVLEDAICNWQKDTRKYIRYTG
ncbi:hypothetical protein QSE00_22525 [Arenibacter sp. M-2]|uniref:alpha-glutamyl/putrescinyl thymine pyrophosphorylase clade 3 protein n=1 Tax=Arenibacter sp. M-2 TaxID=3053612 RepID=UPI002571216D|nr:hypothetical protein [Arenibacter sp. M-2]MDL5514605.1 hypothetical protein [Arenibacter sp. M-2]